MLRCDQILSITSLSLPAFIRANYLELFPKLCDHSQFNRRAHCLRLLVEELPRAWLTQLADTNELFFLIDTKPVPVVGYKRTKKHSNFRSSASYGYCAARHFHYFGYKLLAVTTFSGLPIVYELVAAKTDERAAAEEVLCSLRSCAIFDDKGFIGADWQAEVKERTVNRVWTAKGVNQKEQNPKWFDQLLNGVRERIEGSFNELQNTGRNMERLLAKTVIGLAPRIYCQSNHLHFETASTQIVRP